MKNLLPDYDGTIEPKDPNSLQQVILDLANGVREPENDEERDVLEEIKEAEANGFSLDLPFD